MPPHPVYGKPLPSPPTSDPENSGVIPGSPDATDSGPLLPPNLNDGGTPPATYPDLRKRRISAGAESGESGASASTSDSPPFWRGGIHGGEMSVGSEDSFQVTTLKTSKVSSSMALLAWLFLFSSQCHTSISGVSHIILNRI